MHQDQESRHWFRVAREVAARYVEVASRQEGLPPLPQDAWLRVNRWERLYHKACLKQYPVASRRCRERFQLALTSAIREWATYRDGLLQNQVPAAVPSLREIDAELRALPSEFESVAIDWDENEIVVQTPPIVLEGIDLGSFEIRLRWSELGEPQPYRVVSLAETGHDDVHHPHVQADTLCEGEGKIPISRALSEGRIGDFFLLVRQILHTYNSGSAYVPLSRWYSLECADCGDSVSRNESHICSICEQTSCGYCRRGCARCGDALCSSCADRCESCSEIFCRSCLSTCASCSECCCHSCLCSETCPACLEESEEDSYAPSEDSSLNASPAASSATEASPAQETSAIEIQPACLGQVDLPA
ncbi:hypothetical protein V6x_51890 [Gimesia chilikensis]|uniref:Uncharacterized protein n=1 Tax=Gimesia chilikensis TaxID=2605989 RepID=A0A517WJL8_9PLAN|nr:hypothetical protein [Gimesia chilikensis]QDU05452.1 hypothetical protein V6x_51890 [Gimesia chilikensis]